MNACIVAKEQVQTIKDSNKQNKGTLFFLSFDLVNSTSFKTTYPNVWIEKFESFYDCVEKNAHEISNDIYIWKKQGDEVLLYFKLHTLQELQEVFDKIYNVLQKLIKTVKQSKGGHTLSVKATFWVALVSEKHNDEKVLNLAINSLSGSYDFIGSDIDFGFRIAEKSAGGVICVDPKIIAMLLNNLPPTLTMSKFFQVIDFVQLKGIWDNRFVPITWYHPEISNPDNIFPYDESKHNELVATLLQSKSQNISIITKIFKDLNNDAYIDELVNNINAFSIATGKASLNKTAEVHVVAILFDEKKEKVFCVKRADKKEPLSGKWENGCAKLYFTNLRVKEIIKEYYKQEFKIEIISFKENKDLGYEALEIVGTYQFEKRGRNVPGIIVTGIAKQLKENTFDPAKHSKSQWLSLSEVENLTDKEVVKGFKQRIKRAYTFLEDV